MYVCTYVSMYVYDNFVKCVFVSSESRDYKQSRGL